MQKKLAKSSKCVILAYKSALFCKIRMTNIEKICEFHFFCVILHRFCGVGSKTLWFKNIENKKYYY